MEENIIRDVNKMKFEGAEGIHLFRIII